MRYVASLLASLLMIAPSYAGTRYGSDRFDTWIEVPAGYVAQPEPADGDGRTLISRDGKVRILVWAGWDVSQQGLTAPPGLKVTYKARGTNWAVYSGVKSGKITYEKMVSACKDNDLIHHVLIEYPREMKTRMSGDVAQVAQSLKTGCPSWVTDPQNSDSVTSPAPTPTGR
ncbi:hypothetical protein [Methylobacterium planeticum]|uniref:Uncharacterized protein n=1 Tax=Methylobacterium planeticum TaxID=2615211 RepID=A0A6N6MLM5_9HYPH|nr:hypothetical protein [Methylobacterium planeticum]KAB1072180.1 hypothetical protein F6X51_17310 [Methylobacterium planeticum]